MSALDYLPAGTVHADIDALCEAAESPELTDAEARTLHLEDPEAHGFCRQCATHGELRPYAYPTGLCAGCLMEAPADLDAVIDMLGDIERAGFGDTSRRDILTLVWPLVAALHTGAR